MLPHIAALDIGTNSVQLLVAARTNEGRLRPIAEQYTAPRLGEGIHTSGVLAPEAIQRTFDAISMLLAAVQAKYSPLAGIAAATSAVRDAKNRQEFIGAFHDRFGFMPRILDGEEEALCTFLGAVSDAPENTSTISLDVGGGSTEIGAGIGNEALLTESVDVGCVRLSEQFGLYEPDSSNQEKDAEMAVNALLASALARVGEAVSRPNAVKFLSRMDEELSRWPSRLGRRRFVVPPSGGPSEHEMQKLHGIVSRSPSALVTATGGTATTLAAAILELDTYDAGKVHGHTMSVPELSEFRRRISDMPLGERSKLPGIPPPRAMVLPAGLLILEHALCLLGATTFRISTRGLRHGLLIRLLAGSLTPNWQWT